MAKKLTLVTWWTAAPVIPCCPMTSGGNLNRKLPQRRNSSWEFILGDGTRITRKISTCFLLLPQGEDYTRVILGEAGDEPLLGVVTLEILWPVLNPFNRTLQPTRLLTA
jgi:hypothetical protein